MEQEILSPNFASYEPARSNRFVINVTGTDIPEFLFRNFKLYNEGGNLHLDTEFFEVVNFIFNPNEFFNITDITISELDPTGQKVATTDFNILKSNFEKSGDYGNDEISSVKLNFIVKVTSHKCHFLTKTETIKTKE